MRLRPGVSFDGFQAFGPALDTARRAVEAGAASLWMAEHLGYRQSLVSCTAFAMATERAVVVPTAVSPYMWHPMPVAMAMATIAEAAPGRAALALGSGNPLFLRESGIEIEKPVRAMREFVACLDALWSGEPVRFDGETVRLDGARMAFRPPARVPVYVAAMGERMLDLAGRIGDGVVLSAGLSAAYARRSLAICAAGAAAAGRDPAALRKAAYVFTAVSENGADAVELVRGKLAFLMRNDFLAENVRQSGIPIDREAVVDAVRRRDLEAAARLIPDEAVEAFAVAGAPGACRARLEAYLDAGVDEPVLLILGEAAEQTLAFALLRELAA